MKVLMTTDCVGGVWTYAVQLCAELARHDVEVVLATMGPAPADAQRRQTRDLANVSLHESTFALEWMPDPWAEVRDAGAWLMELAAKCEPDAIHLNGYAHGSLDWDKPVLMVGHSCVLSWWLAVHRCAAPAECNRYRVEVRNGLRAADLVVAPSNAMLQSLRDHYGPLRSAVVISNSRERAVFGPAKKEPLIMTAGRLWDEAKNVAALQQVAPRLPWPVAIAGAEAAHATDQPNTLRLGRLPEDEIARWLGRSSIYALPAKYEPFGLSILEAALSRCALVLGDIPSLRENWHGAAEFVSPDDPDELEEAILRLIEHADHRQNLARLAHRRALEFSPARMAAEYMAAYRQIIQQHRIVAPMTTLATDTACAS
jgi:glycosyltransferase involved in cell wall biosynthesis